MPTNIAWTDETWNPVVGCSRVSDGCKHCYAEALSLRFGWTPKPWAAANAEENVRVRPERLHKPFGWKKPRRVFVNSMSDLFHPLVSDQFIAEVFDVMQRTPQHTYQILTKRPERMKHWMNWPDNVWAGASVEDARVVDRIDHLRATPVRVRFLSCEPLIGSVGTLNLSGIHWVIVGGESGPKHRAMDLGWAREIRDQCVEQQVAFFYKQSSGPRPGMNPVLDGVEWQQFPDELVSAVGR